VRPAWALFSGCKSHREEVIPSEASRNCEVGDHSWGGSGERNRASMDKNRIRGGAEGGERAKDREAAMTKPQVT
jgi:hypothetical protein